GYDPHGARWSDATRNANFPGELLPEVLGPGEIAGSVCANASEECWLPEGLPVVLGATDGMADLVASGAQRAADTNTTLGTTMVWKVLSTEQPRLSGSIYCHRHPGGWLAPGAASNSGPGSVQWSGGEADRWAADLRANERFPTSLICYPLRGTGERFPFHSDCASGFQDGEPASYWDGYAAQLEALAYIERWGYERLAACGVETGGTVYSGGAAARSRTLARVRSSVLQRPVCQSEHPSAAFGAAILAAAGSIYSGDLRSAISRMTHLANVEEPCPELSRQYEDLYGEFRAACARRGYL
ncbi:MAG: FGGY-family carbohydrate kinase, partial [Acidobacteriota bacterium]